MQGKFRTQRERWLAVSTRNPEAGDSFLYGVKTTGVYCRPTCSSRLPNASNIMFFDTPAQAQNTGFRPCKRCRPDMPQAPAHLEDIKKACRFIEQAEDEPSLKELADAAAMSPFHFQRIFRSLVGLTPKQYAKAHRLGRLKQVLGNASTVTSAIYDAGYPSASRGYKGLSTRLGMKPRAYKSKGEGQQIYYGFRQTSLGLLLVAVTEKGICRMALGDSEEALVAELSGCFSKAQMFPAEDDFQEWLEAAVLAVEQPQLSADLPLDIRGTVFQEQVWQVVQRIPLGKTQSYSDVAKAIGHPKAVRAVATACAKNPLTMVIPCHRVIGLDGKLHGYRWGLGRKEAILEKEAATTR